MATAGTLAVNLIANLSPFAQGMDNARRQLKGFANDVVEGGRRLQQVATVAVAAGTGIAAWALSAGAEMETINVRFRTMLGSAAAANALMQDLQNFSASTPFQFADIAKAAQAMLSFGFSVDEVKANLQNLGDIAAGSGANLNDLAQIVGKAFATGRVELGTINQIAERGIPIYTTLQKQLGVSGEELRKMISTGKLGFPQLQTALQSLTADGGLFQDAMVSQSKTLNGQISTLKDNFALLAAKLGEVLIPNAVSAVEKLTSIVQWFKNLSKEQMESVVFWGKLVVAIGAAILIIPKIVTAVGWIVSAFRALAAARAIVLALSGPQGWAILAVGAVVAAGAVYGVSRAYSSLSEEIADAGEESRRYAATVKDEQTPAVDALAEATGGLTDSMKEHNALLEKGRQVAQSMRTPTEIYSDRLSELRELLDHSAISMETYARATAKAKEELLAATDAIRNLPDHGALDASTTAGFVAVIEAAKRAREKSIRAATVGVSLTATDGDGRSDADRSRVMRRIAASSETSVEDRRAGFRELASKNDKIIALLAEANRQNASSPQVRIKGGL